MMSWERIVPTRVVINMSRKKSCRTVLPLCAALALVSTAALGQVADLRLPISLDADSTDYDGKNSMLMFRGLRLSQGSIGITADVGRTSELDFEDSVWEFTGNVTIDTANGHIECETANLQFSDHQLRVATITGSPATFEFSRPDGDQTTYAEAGQLQYDFSSGIVEFSGQATITEGGNTISSNYLLYNIREQRINAQSAGDGEQRVKITYTPGANGAAGDDDATSPEAGTDDEEPDDDESGADSQ